MSTHSDDDLNVSFAKPTISARAYVSRGPSGWPETFKRDVADKALLAFIAPVDLDQLLDVFILQREVSEQKIPDWHTVIGFLARSMQTTPKQVPHQVGIAFWGRYLLALQQRVAN